MPIVVNTNVPSMLTQRYLTSNTNQLENVMRTLASGYRVNAAKDDAAGLSIAANMLTQVRGNMKALDNIQDAMNLIASAETGLETTTNHLQRIRELCVQGGNDVYTSDQKQALLDEISHRLDEIERISKSLSFNGKTLLDGKVSNLYIQIGNGSDKTINTINIGSAMTNVHISAGGLNITTGLVTAAGLVGAAWDSDTFRAYMVTLDAALVKVNTNRSNIGALTNTMLSANENLYTMNESVSKSRSRIMDTDIAQASSDMVKYQILQQTTTSVLSQTNQMPSIAIKLLGA